MNPKPLKAWAIIDIEQYSDPFPLVRWTYAGDEGKKNGLLAIYDKKPTIPEGWEQIKKVVEVKITCISKNQE